MTSLAQQWAEAAASRLCDLGGLSPLSAARVAARWHGVDPADVFVRHAPALHQAWRRDQARATARPTRATDDTTDTNDNAA